MMEILRYAQSSYGVEAELEVPEISVKNPSGELEVLGMLAKIPQRDSAKEAPGQTPLN